MQSGRQIGLHTGMQAGTQEGRQAVMQASAIAIRSNVGMRGGTLAAQAARHSGLEAECIRQGDE